MSLIERQPKLEICEFELLGGGFSLTISLTDGEHEIALSKDALKQKIRMGVSLGAIDEPLKDVNIISLPSVDGTLLTFTVKLMNGMQGFIMVKLD